MSSIVRLDTGNFPYLIREAGNPIVSLIQVSRQKLDAFGNQDLFFLVNGTITTRGRYDSVETTIEVRHSFARDDEDDTATVAQLTLQSLQFLNADRGLMRFNGWLTTMNFYPTEEVEDPFVGAENKPGHDSHGYTKNRGFPYLPPRIHIANVGIPFQVKVEIYQAGQYDLDNWVAELEKGKS